MGNDYNRSFFRRSFFIFFIVLGAKLILLRYLLFHFYQFTSAIWFDLSYLAVILAFIDLFVRKGRVVLYIAVDLLFSLICLSFVLYAGYFETLPSYYDLFQLDQAGTVGGSIILLLSPVYGLFFIDFIGFLFLPLVHKRLSGKSSSWKITGAVLAVGLVVIVSDFLVNQHEEIADPALFAADHGIMNFEVTRFTRNPAVSVAAEVDFTNQDILRLKGVVPVPTEQHVMFGKAKGKNLIMIQVESLQDFIIGKKINGQEITPNLNDLIHENYYFTNVFQQIGAGNTSDAEFMANTSYYPIGDKPTSETIVGTEIPSLPRLLGKVGYWSATFHTDELTYWNRDEMYPALGFDQFYEKPYFGNEDVVGHGASDEVLFNKSLDILLKKQQEEQLFYAHIITVTSHTPFKMPEDKQMLELPDKYKGTLVGNYFQAQHYTDYAIGKFVKSLKVTGLWDESVVVIYGDHSGVHGRLMTDEDRALLHDFLGRHYSLSTRFNIPLIIAVPGSREGLTFKNTGGQVDFMPTLTTLLGIKDDYLHFGQDLFQYRHNLLGMRYYLPTGSFIDDDVLYVRKTAKFPVRVYNLENKGRVDDEMAKPKKRFEEEREDVLKLLRWSDTVTYGLLE